MPADPATYPPGRPSAWAEMLRAWPVLAFVVTGFVFGLFKWADAQSTINVIERRQMEIERRIGVLESTAQSLTTVLSEMRVTLGELRTDMRLMRDELRRLPGRRGEAGP